MRPQTSILHSFGSKSTNKTIITVLRITPVGWVLYPVGWVLYPVDSLGIMPYITVYYWLGIIPSRGI